MDDFKLKLRVSDTRFKTFNFSDEQQKYLTNPIAMFNTNITLGVFTYARSIYDPEYKWYITTRCDNSSPINIYAEYYKVLENDGRFLYKSASLAGLKAVFFTAFLKGGENVRRPHVSQDAIIKIEHHEIDKIMVCKSELDEALYQKIAANINQIGDRYVLNKNEFTADSMHHSVEVDSRLSIKSQVFLLQRAGFNDIQVAFGEFKDWGYSKLPLSVGAYSLLISARKPPSK